MASSKKQGKKGDYNPDEFVVPATDARGNSERVNLRMSPMYLAAMQDILQSRLFPYRTIQDVIRDAVKRHLRYLSTLDTSITSLMGQIQAVDNIVCANIRQIEFMRSVEDMKKTVASLLKAGANEEAVSVLANVKHEVEKIKNKFFREHFLAAIQPLYEKASKSSKSVKVGKKRKVKE